MVGGERRGFALVELVVASAMLLFVVQVSWWVVASQTRASRHVVEAGRAAEARRTAQHLLASELAAASGRGEMTVTDGEVLMRGFRGVLAFCEGAGRVWWVNVAGTRDAAPEKDSVLVHDRWLGWSTAGLVRRRPSTDGVCPPAPGFSEERWELDRDLAVPLIGRYFERTGYRFSDGALRTLAGRAWQPVTEASVDDAASTLSATGPRGLRVTLAWAGPAPFDEPSTWVSWKGR